MQNIPAKAIVIAIIGGGFMFTGDLGWLANRGLRVLDAADVPPPAVADHRRADDTPAAAAVAAPVPVTAAPAKTVEPEPAIPVSGIRAPAGGAEQVAWTSLRAGDRIVVWLAGRGPRCLVLDVVDPAAGEVLAYEVATVSATGLPLAAAGPPGRVVVGRLEGGHRPAIVPGGMIQLAPAGIASSGDEGRWLGPVEAVRLVN